MPNKFARANGNFSDATIWSLSATGLSATTVPGLNDDAYSNGFTVAVDTSTTVGGLRNNNASTGGFFLSSGVILQCPNGISSGGSGSAVPTVTYNLPDTAVIYANITGVDQNCMAVSHAGNGKLTIVGNLVGGGNGNSAVRASSTGEIEIIGTVFGAGVNSITFIHTGGGNIRITGGVDSRSGSSGQPMTIANASLTNITGNITTATTRDAVVTTSTGILIVNGTIISGGTGVPVLIASTTQTGTVLLNCSLIVGSAGGSAVSIASPNVTIRVSGNILNAANGVQAIYAPSYRIDPVPANSYIRYARNGTGVGSDAWLYQFTTDSLSAFSMPPISAVRLGTTFANGTLVGTCAIPTPSSVALGVPVDNTVGAAFLNAADAGVVLMSTPLSSLTVANSLGLRLKNSASSEAIGKILASNSYG